MPQAANDHWVSCERGGVAIYSISLWMATFLAEDATFDERAGQFLIGHKYRQHKDNFRVPFVILCYSQTLPRRRGPAGCGWPGIEESAAVPQLRWT